MSVSVRKIAKLAQVSPATVSRVLNDFPYVRQEVRRKVIEAAACLGYSPRKNIIWIILPQENVFSGYHKSLLQALYKEAELRNLHLLIVSEKDIPVLGGLYLCDGVISLPYRIGFEKKWGAAEALPMVCINSESRPGDNILRVSSNNHQGIFLALEHFKSKGHKKIVFINMDTSSPQNSTDARERQSAYTEWMQKNLPGTEIEIIYYFDTKLQFRQLIDRGVTALLVPGEEGTVEIIMEAKRQNIRIPEELSIIGMESERTISLQPPAVTTIGQNWQLVVATACDLLEKLINKQPASDQFIDFTFNARSSVRSVTE